MLRAIVDKNAEEKLQATRAAEDAEAQVAEQFRKIGSDLFGQSVKRASEVRQQTLAGEEAVAGLERAAEAQASEAREWLEAYDEFCHGVQEMGETEDWLQHMEAKMRSLSVELEHVSLQLEFAHDRREPA